MKNKVSKTVDLNTLIKSISQLQPIGKERLEVIKREILNASIPYQASYEEYQSGGWHTLQLYSPANNKTNEISDGHAHANAIMDEMPETKKFLDGLGFDFFSVRIAKSSPGAYLWEHVDYIELGEEQKVRLHIPLMTNPGANMQIGGTAVNMKDGFIWKLNPTTNHAISNTGEDERIHLILDCYLTDKLKEMLAKEFLDGTHVRQLPALTPEDRQQLLRKAKELLIEEGQKKAEDLLLKAYHTYDLGDETSYDLLIELYKDLQFKERELYWTQEAITRVAERKKINPIAEVKVAGDFFQASQAKSDIPQYTVLSEVLKGCVGIDGLEEAYVRGSLARGDADSHSDIDLLCVVSPEKFQSFVESANKMIEEKYGAAFPGWTDTIVKDFGGVGLVYLIEREEKMYQLDLYISCQGGEGLKRLDNVPHKQRLYRKHVSNTLSVEQNAVLSKRKYDLHAVDVQNTIHNINAAPDTAEKTAVELCVLAFMIKKCLSRNDNILAANEFNMWKKCLIKLARQKFDPELKDYGFYHTKKLQQQMNDNGYFYQKLNLINDTPLTGGSFRDAHTFAMDFMKEHFPDIYTQHKEAFETVSKHITAEESSVDRSGVVPFKRQHGKPGGPR